MYIFLNDRIIPASEAKVSVYDHGFLYGDGIYETVRAYKGTVFMLARHLGRLGRSASLIRLRLPEGRFIEDAVHETLAANGLSEAYVRITLSRGEGPIGLDPELCGDPTFVVIAERFREYPAACYEKGMKIVFAQTRRNLRDAIDPRIKSLNFLNNILAKIEAKDRGADEAVMLNSQGFLTEGTVCNIFFVGHGVLCTPSVDAGILDGITRDIVIGLAKREGVKVEEGMFRPNDLLRAEEVFFTNTTAEVMPVGLAEGVAFEVGKITRTLRTLYREEVEAYMRDHGK
ncbi:MAG: aminotransferase class IV [Acidobacteriota bacterium]